MIFRIAKTIKKIKKNFLYRPKRQFTIMEIEKKSKKIEKNNETKFEEPTKNKNLLKNKQLDNCIIMGKQNLKKTLKKNI